MKINQIPQLRHSHLFELILILLSNIVYAQYNYVGQMGSPNYVLQKPVGLSIDNTNNRLFIANNRNDPNAGLNNQILAFNTVNQQYLFSVGDNELHNPAGVFYDNINSELYVTDWGSLSAPDAIYKYDANFNLTLVITGPTFSPFTFNNPAAITVGTDGTMYIADTGNNRIVIRTSAGVFSQLNMVTDGISAPRGIAVDDANDRIYVSNFGTNQIKVFKKSDRSLVTNWSFTEPYHCYLRPGKLYVTSSPTLNRGYVVTTTGDAGSISGTTVGTGSGSGMGQFNLPIGITVDASDKVYMSDYGYNRIQAFSSPSPSYNWLWWLATPILFNNPAGVVVNPSNGKLYVADLGNDRVQVFDRSSGTFLNSLAASGWDEPLGVAVDRLNQIYVTSGNTSSARIDVFTSGEIHSRTVGSFGSGSLQFNEPNGIYVAKSAGTGQDWIYIADQNNGRVVITDNAGSSVKGTITGLSSPRGVVYDDNLSTRRIFVAETGANKIRVYEWDASLTSISEISAASYSGVSTPYHLSYFNNKLYVTSVAGPQAPITILDVDPSTGTLSLSATLPNTRGTRGTSAGVCGNLDLPIGVSAAPDGEVYGVSFGNHEVHRWTSSGSCGWVIGGNSASPINGAFNKPNDVYVAPDGRIFVADQKNHRIQVFNSSGGFLTTFGSYGTIGNGTFNEPRGVFVTSGYIYVADWLNNLIQVFNASTYAHVTQFSTGLNPADVWVEGSRVYVICQSPVYGANSGHIEVRTETPGSPPTYGSASTYGGGELNQPQSIAVGSNGFIYVADTGNSRIKIFDSSGTPLSGGLDVYNASDDPLYILSIPQGIFVDDSNIVYVGDTGRNRVVSFSSCGGVSWVTRWSFGVSGLTPGQFNQVAGVALNMNSSDPGKFLRCVAVDRLNNRVQIFNPLPYIGVRKACTTRLTDGSYTEDLGSSVPNDAGALPYSNTWVTYTIENLGNVPLNLTGTPSLISNSNSTHFNLIQPSVSTLARGATATFQIRFEPKDASPSLKTTTLSISNSETTSRNPFTFDVQGTSINATVYIWTVAAASGLYSTPGNWSSLPGGFPRSAPAKSDILVFNSGGVKQMVFDTPLTDTVGQIVITGNTDLTIFNSQIGNSRIALKGTVSTDLMVTAGSSLTIKGDNALQLNLAQGVTGNISGGFVLTNAIAGNPAHRLKAIANNAITFASGSTFTAKNLSGHPFGINTEHPNDAAKDVIVFNSGSTYYSKEGLDPFALTAPDSRVVFQSGSTYIHQQSNLPSLNGRTYGNFTYDYAGTVDVNSGGSTASVNTFLINQGTFRISNNQPLNISGNLNIQSLSSLEFQPNSSSLLRFNGSSTQQILGGGSLIFNSNLTVEVDNNVVSTSPAITLQKDLAISGILKVTQGDVNLNGNTIDLGTTGQLQENIVLNYVVKDITATYDYDVNSCVAVGNCSDTGVLGGKIIASTRTVNGSNIAGLGLSLNDITPGYTVNVARYHYRGDKKGITRAFHITNGTPTSASVTIQYADEDWNSTSSPILSESSGFVMFRNAPTTWGWVNYGGTHDASANTVSLMGVTAFSRWTLGNGDVLRALPIELTFFDGKKLDDGSARLIWKTASELNNDRFEIEKSTGEVLNFRTIGSVKGSNETSVEKEYSFVDLNFFEDSYYRLKQIDFDGSFTYSKIKFIKTDIEASPELQAIPNPFTSEINLKILTEDNPQVQLNIVTINGLILKNFTGALSYVNLMLNNEIQSMKPGLYVITVQSEKERYFIKVIRK